MRQARKRFKRINLGLGGVEEEAPTRFSLKPQPRRPGRTPQGPGDGLLRPPPRYGLPVEKPGGKEGRVEPGIPATGEATAKTASPLEEYWRKRILAWLQAHNPKLYKCYEKPSACKTGREVEIAKVKRVQDLIKELSSLITAIKNLGVEFKSGTPRENPATSLAAFLRAKLHVYTKALRDDPDKLADELKTDIATAKLSLENLRNAIKNGARAWSEDKCTSPGCVSSTGKITAGDNCIVYTLLAFQYPESIAKTANVGIPPKGVYAIVSREACTVIRQR